MENGNGAWGAMAGAVAVFFCLGSANAEPWLAGWPATGAHNANRAAFSQRINSGPHTVKWGEAAYWDVVPPVGGGVGLVVSLDDLNGYMNDADDGVNRRPGSPGTSLEIDRDVVLGGLYHRTVRDGNLSVTGAGTITWDSGAGVPAYLTLQRTTIRPVVLRAAISNNMILASDLHIRMAIERNNSNANLAGLRSGTIGGDIHGGGHLTLEVGSDVTSNDVLLAGENTYSGGTTYYASSISGFAGAVPCSALTVASTGALGTGDLLVIAEVTCLLSFAADNVLSEEASMFMCNIANGARRVTIDLGTNDTKLWDVFIGLDRIGEAGTWTAEELNDKFGMEVFTGEGTLTTLAGGR